VRIEESGEQLVLPSQDIVSLGRSDAMAGGTRANDIVLTHPDREAQLAISRNHFELRRTRHGHMLRTASNKGTEVDGEPISVGEEVQVRPGTIVRLAQVMTLRFLGSDQAYSPRDAVTLKRGMAGKVYRAAIHDPDQGLDRTASPASSMSPDVPAAVVGTSARLQPDSDLDGHVEMPIRRVPDGADITYVSRRS
jgi:predicted component of type VI protein secretion system